MLGRLRARQQLNLIRYQSETVALTPFVRHFQNQVFLENPKRSKRALKIQSVVQRQRRGFLEKTTGTDQRPWGVPEISFGWDRQAAGFTGRILGDWIAPKLHGFHTLKLSFRIVASLDRKRLGTKVSRKTTWTRGVFDV